MKQPCTHNKKRNSSIDSCNTPPTPLNPSSNKILSASPHPINRSCTAGRASGAILKQGINYERRAPLERPRVFAPGKRGKPRPRPNEMLARPRLPAGSPAGEAGSDGRPKPRDHEFIV